MKTKIVNSRDLSFKSLSARDYVEDDVIDWIEQCPEDVERVAQQLHEYVQFRAQQEGVEYSLSPAFFSSHIMQRCAFFFGVHYDRQGITYDEQEPKAGFFKAWKDAR